MKATNLMIGDWVLVKELDFSNLANVISEYQHQIRLKDFAEMYNAGEYKKYEPISLTKEILHKNGFDGDVYLWINADDEKILEYYPFEHRLSLWYGEEKNQEILFKCHCFYVHELQHALKMCGIEKEIVL